MITEAILKNSEDQLIGYVKIDISNVEEGVDKNLPKNINVVDFSFIDSEKLLPESNKEIVKKISEKQNEIDRLILKKEQTLIYLVKELRKIEVKLLIGEEEYSVEE